MNISTELNDSELYVKPKLIIPTLVGIKDKILVSINLSLIAYTRVQYLIIILVSKLTLMPKE